MNPTLLIPVIALALPLTGCAPTTRIDPSLVGDYRSASGEQLMIHGDGSLQYRNSRVTEWLGATRKLGEAEGDGWIVWQPDTSPFLGTKVRITGKRNVIIVDWNDPRPHQPERSRRFFRD